MKVLCWDIDGTLLSTNRAGVFALVAAAADVLGTETDFADLFTSGLTDPEVAAAAIEYCGGAGDDETRERFLRSYESHLPRSLPRRAGRVMPNVEAILERVAARPDLHQVLLTGNTRRGAKAKLAHYGLDRYFEGGAFSDDAADRSAIAGRALELARERGGPNLPANGLIVIGDTPHDIACGKAIGARTLAVATGVHSIELLAEYQPDICVEQLPAPDALFALLGLD